MMPIKVKIEAVPTNTPTPSVTANQTPTPTITPTQTPTITPTPTPTPPFTCASCRTYNYTATTDGSSFNYYRCDTGILETVSGLFNGETGIACNCNSVGTPYFSPGSGTFSDDGPC